MSQSQQSIELLECVIVQATIGVPRDAIDRLIDYELSPLPSPARYVGGLGVIDDTLLVSIALTPALGTGRRSARGVLLRTPAGSGRWAIEITKAGSFVRATTDPRATPSDAHWLTRMTMGSSRSLLSIDVMAMIADLSVGTAAA